MKTESRRQIIYNVFVKYLRIRPTFSLRTWLDMLLDYYITAFLGDSFDYKPDGLRPFYFLPFNNLVDGHDTM